MLNRVHKNKLIITTLLAYFLVITVKLFTKLLLLLHTYVYDNVTLGL